MLQNGVSHRCAFVKLSAQGGITPNFGEGLPSLKKYRAIWGIAAIVLQCRVIWGRPFLSGLPGCCWSLFSGLTGCCCCCRRRCCCLENARCSCLCFFGGSSLFAIVDTTLAASLAPPLMANQCSVKVPASYPLKKSVTAAVAVEDASRKRMFIAT